MDMKMNSKADGYIPNNYLKVGNNKRTNWDSLEFLLC